MELHHTPRMPARMLSRICAIVPILLALSSPLYAAAESAADQLLADEDFSAAADAYRELIAAGVNGARNRFQLGRALHEAGNAQAARDAYLAALDAGFEPPAQARYHLARAEMALGNTEAALAQLEILAGLGGPPAQVVEATAEFAALADNARFMEVLEALRPCNSPEHHQFDFWLGHWDVTPAGATETTAENRISPQQGGCVVFEQYVHDGYSGMSINFYDSATHLWHQSWMDNNGGAVQLQGGLNDAGEMVMSDRDLAVSTLTGTVNRITWSPLDSGEVRQHWEASEDGGESWKSLFDGIYRRRPEP